MLPYNPKTGLAYYPAIHLHWAFSDSMFDLRRWRSPDWRADMGVSIAVTGVRSDGVAGSLQAWDPVRRKLAWEVPLDGVWQPGTMTSAGNLVFQGSAGGNFVAYHAGTGKELWRFNVGHGISAPPITYSAGGRQYVALLVGWGGAMAGVGGAGEAARGWSYGAQTRRLIAFSLEGSASLPSPGAPVVPKPLAAPEFGVEGALAAAGMAEYEQTCSWCHGGGAVSAGMAPDLRASGIVLSATKFADVVREGERRAKGMPQFAELTDQQLLAMRHYIRMHAEAALRTTPRPSVSPR